MTFKSWVGKIRLVSWTAEQCQQSTLTLPYNPSFLVTKKVLSPLISHKQITPVLLVNLGSSFHCSIGGIARFCDFAVMDKAVSALWTNHFSISIVPQLMSWSLPGTHGHMKSGTCQISCLCEMELFFFLVRSCFEVSELRFVTWFESSLFLYWEIANCEPNHYELVSPASTTGPTDLETITRVYASATYDRINL